MCSTYPPLPPARGVAWIDVRCRRAVHWAGDEKLETDRSPGTYGVAYLATCRCPPGHVYHAACRRTGTQHSTTLPPTQAPQLQGHHTHGGTAARATGPLLSFFVWEEEEEIEPNQREGTRAHLPLALHPAAAVHCPPDTSRTGALQAFVPRRHARTPTAGAGPVFSYLRSSFSKFTL